MAQRIFDIENKKDYADLWDILPDRINNIKLVKNDRYEDFVKEVIIGNDGTFIPTELILINWHDKTEITRPIQEATEQDIGKICMFSSSLSNSKYYGVLIELRETAAGTRYIAQSCNGTYSFVHAYRLTKQEIKELC